MGYPIWVHTWRDNATGKVFEQDSIFTAAQEYRPTLTLVTSRLRGDSTGEVVNPYTVDDLIKISLPDHHVMTAGTIPNPFEQLPPAPAATTPPAMGIQPATVSPMKAVLSGVSLVSAVAFLFKRG